MGWRVARSLEVLRDQINAAYPGRNKASDGTIGDAAHAASISDHNPDAGGVVRALDITHDPAHGCDIDQLTDALAASRDSRISYLIANRLITGPEYGWVWTAYYGDDPHSNHFHLSVVADGRADDTRPWNIGNGNGGTGGQEEMDAQTEQALKVAFAAPYDGKSGISGQSWMAKAVEAPLRTLTGSVAQLARDVAELRQGQSAVAEPIDYDRLAAALLDQVAARRTT